MLRPSYQITRHRIGSVKEVWTISWPLILGLISNGMMVLVDRLMLGHYSLEAMNAASTASAASFAIFIFPMVVAGISEVFVGRFHGQESYNKMGVATWQLIWFAILLVPLFVIASKTVGPLIFSNSLRPDYANSYFSIMVNFGSMFCLIPALMGFFIGQGKVRVISYTIAIANVLNFGLDYALIFGTPFSPSFGVSGAACATVSSQFFLAGVFFFFFLKKKNRQEKGTGKWKLQPKLFFDSLKTGIPASFAHVAEYVSYFIFLRYMDKLGGYFLTVAVLLNSVYMIIYFIIEGMSKGVTAICANLIGVKKYDLVRKNLFSACKLHLFFVVGLSTLVIFGSPGIYRIFIGEGDKAILMDPFFLNELYVSTIYMCLFYLFDGVIWMIIGLLTAASDTKFIMFVGTFAPFLLFVLPIYLFSMSFQVSPKDIWLYSAFYGVLHLCIYWLRYRSGAWRTINQTQDPSIPLEL